MTSNEIQSPVSNKRTDSPVVPAGMEWDASEYVDKDGLEADKSGLVYFADARSDAWHQLGQQFGRAMTAEELMRESRLGGWDVRKTPIQTITEDGVFEIPGKFATVRTNPSTGKAEPLGSVVGNFYTTIQNETATDMLQLITDQSGAIFETAGSLNSGRNVFVTMKLPENMLIGGVDEVEMNIAWLNSHDGTSRQRTLVTPTRIVCQNTQRAAIKGAVTSYAISHTSGAQARQYAAREALRLTFEYAEAFEIEANKMIAAAMTKDQLVKTIRMIWTPPKKDAETGKAPSRAATMHAQREDAIVDLFTISPTNENIRGTAWAGYQAIGEYLDHFQPVQMRGFDSLEAARAARTIMGRTDEPKELAFAKVLAFSAR